MKPFDVYSVYPVNIENGKGCYVFDSTGKKYLDFYGGHAVISIGHSHPHYVSKVSGQLQKLGFYSNSVEIPIQKEVAGLLGELSGYNDYDFFFCNSGAEAIENALKLASFHTDREKVLYFSNSFHGRTSLAVSITDNRAISAPVNYTDHVEKVSWEGLDEARAKLKDRKFCAVIVEGIQGVGGINVAEPQFLEGLSEMCSETGTCLILDEIQSGFGRSGKFFAHQYSSVKPDIITVAKGMGNGFPTGGVLIHPDIKAKKGMLGTTFGGNHLASAAVLSVLEVLRDENLLENSMKMGQLLKSELSRYDQLEVRGLGLMIGIDFQQDTRELRKKLVLEQGVFTGSAKSPNTLRLLPPLTIGEEEVQKFLDSLSKVLE